MKTGPKKDLYKLANEVRKSAHAPYSEFKVGAALIAKDGSTYTGCNVENASYGGTICAERVAILKAVSEGQKKFKEIMVVVDSKKLVPPCAFCLQVMAEFCSSDFQIHLADLEGNQKTFKFKELLPYPFNASFF